MNVFIFEVYVEQVFDLLIFLVGDGLPVEGPKQLSQSLFHPGEDLDFLFELLEDFLRLEFVESVSTYELIKSEYTYLVCCLETVSHHARICSPCMRAPRAPRLFLAHSLSA